MTRRTLLIAGSGALCCGAAAAKPAALHIDASGLPQWEQRFDGEKGKVRLLVLASPTCPICVRGVEALRDLIREFPGDQLRLHLVWEPILDSDILGLQESVLEIVDDARAKQYWDPDCVIANRLGGVERFQTNPKYKILFKLGETPWDIALVYPSSACWQQGKAEPAFAGGQIHRVTEDLRRVLKEHLAVTA